LLGHVAVICDANRIDLPALLFDLAYVCPLTEFERKLSTLLAIFTVIICCDFVTFINLFSRVYSGRFGLFCKERNAKVCIHAVCEYSTAKLTFVDRVYCLYHTGSLIVAA
jgi:hypothetical protein